MTTPEQQAAVEEFLAELQEMIDGTGRHEGHTVSQVGRCAYCSCGKRLGQANAKAIMKDRQTGQP